MSFRMLSVLAVAFLLSSTGSAADYRVEVLKEGPPKDELAPEVAKQLATTGVRLIRGESRALCDIWLVKEAPVKADFKAASEVLYPFSPGQIIGVVRYVNKGADFRDQDIPKGVYTLRYDQQPMDGNHEGTSVTRDFLLLVRAEDDEKSAPMDIDDLSIYSSDAVDTAHPGMLCMMKVQGGAKEVPSIRHIEEDDWWIVRLKIGTKGGDSKKGLLLDILVVGFSDA